MGLLKSVIADARPAKSTLRAHMGSTSVSGQISATSLSNSEHMKTGHKQSDGLALNQTQDGHFTSNSRSQEAKYQPSGLNQIQHNHHAQAKTQTRPELKSSSVSQAKEILRQHKVNDADKPVSRSTQIQSSVDLSMSTSDTQGVSIKHVDSHGSAVEMNAGSSNLSSAERIPFQQSLQPGPDRNFAVDKTSSARVSNDNQDATVKQSINVQTPFQTTSNEQPFDSLEAGISPLSDNDDKVNPSVSSESRLGPQSHTAKGFNEIKLKQAQVYPEDITKQQSLSMMDNESDKLAQNETLLVKTTQLPDGSTNDFQHDDYNSVSPAINRKQSDVDMLVTVEKQLHSLDSEIQQQKDKKAEVEVMAARTTSMIADQLASHHIEPQLSTKHVQITQGSAEVRIGQVDVFIEKPTDSTTHVTRSIRPSISMASRHYLRRL